MHDPHHVYLDLDVINNDYKHDGSPPYLRFEEIRNTPFLYGDNSEYFCSIVRFYHSDRQYAACFHPSDCQRDESEHYDIYHLIEISRSTIFRW